MKRIAYFLCSILLVTTCTIIRSSNTGATNVSALAQEHKKRLFVPCKGMPALRIKLSATSFIKLDLTDKGTRDLRLSEPCIYIFKRGSYKAPVYTNTLEIACHEPLVLPCKKHEDVTYHLFVVSYDSEKGCYSAHSPHDCFTYAIAPTEKVKLSYRNKIYTGIATIVACYFFYKLCGNYHYAVGLQSHDTNGLCTDCTVKSWDIANHCLGCEESLFYQQCEQCITSDSNGLTFIRNSKTGEQYSAGKLQFYSLGYLRKETDNRVVSEKKGSLTCVVGSVDTIQLKYPDSVIQVASNHNALELLNQYDRPEGKTLYAVANDQTQGPVAAVGAPYAYFLRMYAPFRCYYKDGKEVVSASSDEWPQKNDQNRQINLLCDVSDYYPVTNGYVAFTQESLYKRWDYKEQSDKFQILFQKDVDAVGYFSGGKENRRTQFTFVDKPTRINQVFSAAVNRNHQARGGEIDRRAVDLLNANYEGIIRAAILAKKEKVFLTLLGGGAFGNSRDTILQAILHQKDLIEKSGLDVVIVAYNARDKPRIDRVINKK